jgi:hypothetical protein
VPDADHRLADQRAAVERAIDALRRRGARSAGWRFRPTDTHGVMLAGVRT